MRYRPPICGRFKTPTKLWSRLLERAQAVRQTQLLEFDSTAGCFDLALDFFGFSLVDAFFDRLRRALDEALGFGQAETRDRTDFLDDLNFLAAVAGQDNVEFVLFFDCFGCCGWSGNCDCSSGANAP